MAQVWKCVICGGTTTDPIAAGDHERKLGDQGHLMEDLGE